MHKYWIFFCAIATVVSGTWYGIASYRAGDLLGGSSFHGLVLGSVATLIIVFEFLLWPRKKVRAWRIGFAQTWMRAHIWLGLLAVPLVLMHSGFRWGGQLSTVLAILFGIVIASGIFGLVLQNVLPRLMMEQLPAETIYSQIDQVAQQYAQDAQRKIDLLCPPIRSFAAEAKQANEPVAMSWERDNGPVVIGAVRNRGSIRGKVLWTEIAPTQLRHAEVLREAFDSTIHPFLIEGEKTASILATRGKANAWFGTLRNTVDEAARPTVDELETLCEQRRQFDAQARLHWRLHSWIALHLPLSVALLALLMVHIYFALKYW